MKIHQHKAAVEHYHGPVQGFKVHQHEKILRVMRKGRTYTGQQLAHLTGYSPNVISARLYELRECKAVVRPENIRKVCPYSHVEVSVHKRVVKKARKQ